MEHLVDAVHITGFAGRFVDRRIGTGDQLGLVFGRFHDAESNRQAENRRDDMHVLRKLFPFFEVVKHDRLFFGRLRRQGQAGGQQTDVVNGDEARQRVTLGRVFLVGVGVHAVPVRDPDRFTILLAVDVHMDRHRLGIAVLGFARIGQFDDAVIDIGFKGECTTQNVTGLFETVTGHITENVAHRFLSFSCRIRGGDPEAFGHHCPYTSGLLRTSQWDYECVRLWSWPSSVSGRHACIRPIHHQA